MNVWICRDEKEFIGNSCKYRLYKKKPSNDKFFQGRWYGADDMFCLDDFEKLTNLKLLPGEGPIEISLIISRI